MYTLTLYSNLLYALSFPLKVDGRMIGRFFNFEQDSHWWSLSIVALNYSICNAWYSHFTCVDYRKCQNILFDFRVATDVCNGVVTKCLNSPRAKTKEKGQEILMLYIEAEKQEHVQDALMGGLANKQPKIVSGCIVCLREGLRFVLLIRCHS